MKRIALIRGKFLNQFEMQMVEPLTKRYHITAFGSLRPIHDQFSFPVVRLPSPMDIPNFPYKMQILNRLFSDAHVLYGLEKRLRGYDLVHTAELYYHYTQQALEAKKRGWVGKVIATELDNIPFNNEGIWGRRGFKARARRELDHIIALSELTKRTLVTEGTDPEKITVLGFFVDTKRFSPAKSGTKIAHTPLRILFVGRLETYKGVLDILGAAKMLMSTHLGNTELEFVFVGEGSELDRMKRLERQFIKNWHFTHLSANYVDMPDIFRQADIFIAPSQPTATWQEQYGMMLLEAQSTGLPIITTASGAIPENVGDAAIIVAPGDVVALADALSAFIVAPQKRLAYAKRARLRALKVHDINLGADKLAAIYDRVLRS
jgi:glycosyltransferase involved in cell wall biosynthesis